MKKHIIKYCISFSLIFFLIWKVDIQALFASLSKIDLTAYIIATLVWCFALAIKTKRWNYFLPTHHFFDLFKYTFISIYYSSILTGPLVGDGAKAYRLIQRDKYKSKTIAASVVLENLTHYTAAPFSGIIGLLFVSPPYQNEILSSLFIAFAAFGMIIVCGQYASTRLANKQQQWCSSKYLRVLTDFSDAYQDLGRKSRTLFLSIALAIPFYFLCAAVNYIIFTGMGFQVSYFDFCWINAVMAVILLFPITIAGLGVREVGMASLLTLVGLNVNQAMAGIIIVFSIQIVGAFLGFIFEMSLPEKVAAAES